MRRRELVRIPRAESDSHSVTRLTAARRAAAAAAYLALAWTRGGPGIAMRLRAARLAARMLVGGDAGKRMGWELLLSPMDSFRYFEFEFAWRGARRARAPLRYLDVSSPRLFPATFLAAHPLATADLVNPDAKDLAVTRDLIQSLGVASRCTLTPASIEAFAPKSEQYDLVTSLSVIEHIPEPADFAAVERMWACLRPGGTLIVTVPCAPSSFDEYLDLDEYGFQPRSADGFWFGQRFYDEALVRDRFVVPCGEPARMVVFGERAPGTFNADRALKSAGRARWAREPYTMATEYRRYGSIAELPGVGVVGLEFRKR